MVHEIIFGFARKKFAQIKIVQKRSFKKDRSERVAMKTSCRGERAAKWILAVLLLPASLRAEPVSLKRVVELALSHATGAAITAADELHAAASYQELHNNYIPQLSTGAGLGYSYGFPLALEGSAPALFNVTAQSALFNPALRANERAAKADSAVAAFKTKDQRNQIIQDAALSYAELAKWEQRLARLQETEADANKLQAAVANRVKEGVDSELEGLRARLAAARVRQRIGEAQDAADVLREHLSKLTGLSPTNIQTDPDSIPAPPAPLQRRKRPRKMPPRPIPRCKPPSNTPAHSTCELRENIALCGRASISPRNMLCSQNSTTIRTITFRPGHAPHRLASFCA